MLSLLPERLDELLLLGAHCDDIAVGAGGTLLELCRAHPGTRVTALVLTGGGSLREEEERAALTAFCPGARLQIAVLDLPSGRLAARWERVKDVLDDLRRRTEPDIILAPARQRIHQDHRTLTEMVPTSFGDHLTLGYECLKWTEDLPSPNLFLPLAEPVLRDKSNRLLEHYGSQSDQGWFDIEAFAGLARRRGAQCRARYAEAFEVSTVVLGAGALAPVNPY